MAKKDGLSKRQKLFCAEYLIDLNATQAAIRAGYSEKTAHVQGPRLLENVSVQEEIQHLMSKRMERLGYSADQVLINVTKMANYDIRDIVEIDTESIKGLFRFNPATEDFDPIEGPQATIIRIKQLDDKNAHLITKLKQGKYGLEIEFPDRLKANDLMMKHFKLYAERLDLTGEFTHKHEYSYMTDEELDNELEKYEGTN